MSQKPLSNIVANHYVSPADFDIPVCDNQIFQNFFFSVSFVLSAVPFWDLTFGKSVLVSELPYLFRRDSQPVTWCRFLDRVYRDIWKLLFKILKVPRAIIRHSFAYKNQACQWANCRVFRAVLGRISKKPITEHLRQDRTSDRFLTEIQTSSSNLYRFCSLSLL